MFFLTTKNVLLYPESLNATIADKNINGYLDELCSMSQIYDT